MESPFEGGQGSEGAVAPYTDGWMDGYTYDRNIRYIPVVFNFFCNEGNFPFLYDVCGPQCSNTVGL